jgi:hypothetical protein
MQRPEYALFHLLEFEDCSPPHPGRIVGEVAPLATPRYRVEMPYLSVPDLLEGINDAAPLPCIADASDPQKVILLEPPGFLLEPEPGTREARATAERDARTRELLQRFPPPSVAELRRQPGTGTRYDAALFRVHLVTTIEAHAVADRIARGGAAWEDAGASVFESLGPWVAALDEDMDPEVADPAGHLASVGPDGDDIDESALLGILLILKARDEVPRLLDPEGYATLTEPWIQVLGPIDR